MADHRFLLMWCNEGLEYVCDVTAVEQKQMWNTLAGSDKITSLPNLHQMILRARYNTQRHYEIYLVDATEGITETDIKEMFDNSPQYSADLIRERGIKVYSDRIDTNKQVIT